MNMNQPSDENLKQGRNRSWLLVKVRLTEEVWCPLHVMLVFIEMLDYSSYLYPNFSDNITEICHGLRRTDNIPQHDIHFSSQESSFCEYIWSIFLNRRSQVFWCTFKLWSLSFEKVIHLINNSKKQNTFFINRYAILRPPSILRHPLHQQLLYKPTRREKL